MNEKPDEAFETWYANNHDTLSGDKLEALHIWNACKNYYQGYGQIKFGDDIAYLDIRAAVVMDDGSIAKTLNGAVITPGTSLWLRRE